MSVHNKSRPSLSSINTLGPNPPWLPLFKKFAVSHHQIWSPSSASPQFERMDFNNIRALLVGAGGIGCELLKTLCLHNFKEIFIVSSPLLMLLMFADRFRHNRLVQFESTIPLPITTHQEIQSAGTRISEFRFVMVGRERSCFKI